MHSRFVHILCVATLLTMSYLEFHKLYHEAYPTIRPRLIAMIPETWLTWGDQIFAKLF